MSEDDLARILVGGRWVRGEHIGIGVRVVEHPIVPQGDLVGENPNRHGATDSQQREQRQPKSEVRRTMKGRRDEKDESHDESDPQDDARGTMIDIAEEKKYDQRKDARQDVEPRPLSLRQEPRGFLLHLGKGTRSASWHWFVASICKRAVVCLPIGRSRPTWGRRRHGLSKRRPGGGVHIGRACSTHFLGSQCWASPGTPTTSKASMKIGQSRTNKLQ
mmetsp:Transcript_64121/g.134806  ORF Transcript_64121/g.134806 Transcript_64121/m.134806 type:complete len:218 (-) Transcript_64121:130-783(-)